MSLIKSKVSYLTGNLLEKYTMLITARLPTPHIQTNVSINVTRPGANYSIFTDLCT